jgi:hypothetical protein
MFSLSPLPQPLGFYRPKYHICHPSLNVVAVTVAVPLNAVAVPPNIVAVHSSTRRHHLATVGHRTGLKVDLQSQDSTVSIYLQLGQGASTFSGLYCAFE